MSTKLQSKVSMVVPCYNKERYIGDMLRSVHEQIWDNIEVILVNDGSTDGTRGVISQWEPKLRERGYDVVIIDQENRGCCAAVYAGLIRMTGDYFCLVDCDDEIKPEYVSRMAGWLDGHDDYEWAACSFQRRKNIDGKLELQPFDITQDTERMLENYILRRIRTMTWIYMTRVSYIKSCKMIENFCTERRATYEPLIAVPLMAGGGKLKFFNEPLYIFNVFANDLFRTDSYQKTISYYDDYLRQYKWSIYQLPISRQEQNRLYKMAEFMYFVQILLSIEKLPDRELYHNTHIDNLLKVVSGLFDPPVEFNTKCIQKHGYLGLVTAVKEHLLGIKPETFKETKRKIIAWGVLGRRASKLLPELEGTKYEPTELWDANGDGIAAKKPAPATLAADDLVIIMPKDSAEITKELEAVGFYNTLTYDNIKKNLQVILFPEFYDGSIKFNP